MSRPHNEPPEWFLDKDYSYLESLDAKGWARELIKCNGKLRTLEEREAFKRDWGGILGDSVNSSPGFIGPPAVDVVEKADLSTLHALERPAMIVQVYLRAPDTVIIDEFKMVLAAARKEHPLPIKMRGPTGQNVEFNKSVFDKWIHNKIVQLADLIEWKAHENVKVTDADFGRWLFDGYDQGGDEHKLINKARAVLDEAIRSIPALHTQVAAARSKK